MTDRTRAVTDKREAKRQADEDALRINLFNEAVKNLLQKNYGRTVLQRIMRECKVFDDIVPMDAQATAHALGKRTIGLWIRNTVKAANPEALALMEHEEGLEPASRRMSMP